MLIKKSKIKIIRCLMDICVYVHVNKVIRCEYNNSGWGVVLGGREWNKTNLGGGGAHVLKGGKPLVYGIQVLHQI